MHRIDKLEHKIDGLRDTNEKQNVTLGKMEVLFEKQQAILEEHHKRSLHLEKIVEILEKKFEKHLSFVKGAFWLFGLLLTLLGMFVKFKS